MPTEEITEKVEETRTRTRYICAVDGCDESTESFDPRGTKEVANENSDVPHTLNWVALNPYVGMKLRSGQRDITEHVVKEQTGVYVCDDHLDRVGDLLTGTMDGDENG